MTLPGFTAGRRLPDSHRRARQSRLRTMPASRTHLWPPPTTPVSGGNLGARPPALRAARPAPEPTPSGGEPIWGGGPRSAAASRHGRPHAAPAAVEAQPPPESDRAAAPSRPLRLHAGRPGSPSRFGQRIPSQGGDRSTDMSQSSTAFDMEQNDKRVRVRVESARLNKIKANPYLANSAVLVSFGLLPLQVAVIEHTNCYHRTRIIHVPGVLFIPFWAETVDDGPCSDPLVPVLRNTVRICGAIPILSLQIPISCYMIIKITPPAVQWPVVRPHVYILQWNTCFP